MILNSSRREAMQLLGILSLSIMVVEMAIMFLLEYAGIGHGVGENVGGAAVLTIALFPILYLAVVRRLARKNQILKAQSDQLQDMRAKLEQRVEKRTQDLNGSVRQLQLHQQEITILGEMTRLLQAAKSLEEASAVAKLELVRLLPGLAGTLYLMNASRNLLEPQIMWGETTAMALMEPRNCWALRRGKPHRVADDLGVACDHARNCPAAWRLCIPLMAASETMGVLCLEANAEGARAAPGGSFDGPGRLEFYETVAESLAMAISNIKLYEKLQHQALRDPLTGLYNRRYMLEALERELHLAARNQQPTSVMMLDIDQFKLFNDTFGHEAGDAVIAAVGELLRNSVRRSDFVGRFGGEEFLLVLPDTTSEKGVEIAGKLRAGVEALSLYHQGQPLGKITISAGVASYPAVATGHEELIEAADRALYLSKRNGRNCVTPAEHAAISVKAISDQRARA